MTAVQMIAWIFVGALTAILFLLTQQWSVKLIKPQNPRRSISLIVGGTFMRWVFIFAVFFVSLSYSFTAMLIVFITFLFIRLLFLLKWHGWLRLSESTIHQSKG
jgi:hypothetical protein